MFEQVATEDLLREVRAHDFEADSVADFGASRIDAITALDRLIRAGQAEQVAQIAALHAERVMVMPLGHGDPSLSVIGEVSMARNISPSAAGTQLGLALGLDRLPQVFGLFKAGQISEQIARAVVNESVSLAVDDFVILDAEIAPLLPGLTHIKARQSTARAVIRIDAEAALMRAAANRADCRATMFPDADGVAILQVRGPAEQIVATYNSLDAWARGLRSTGDDRTVGQIMCQTLVERVTGRAHADTIDVEVELVMDAKNFIGDDGGPVELTGYGPISPDVADDIIARAPNRSIRRLLVDPIDGTLVVREPRRRHFDSPTRSHIRARDRRCRQPGCDAKIRDNDHIHAYADGGTTTKGNAQGLCKRSHTIKGLSGWNVTTDGKATIWTTPTGHTYTSHPPPLLGHLRQ